MADRFEDLEAWRTARELTRLIFDLPTSLAAERARRLR